MKPGSSSRVDGDEAAEAGFAEERLVPIDGVRAEARPVVDIPCQAEDAIHRDAYAHAVKIDDEAAALAPQRHAAFARARQPVEDAARRVVIGKNAGLIVVELLGQAVRLPRAAAWRRRRRPRSSRRDAGRSGRDRTERASS